MIIKKLGSVGMEGTRWDIYAINLTPSVTEPHINKRDWTFRGSWAYRINTKSQILLAL